MNLDSTVIGPGVVETPVRDRGAADALGIALMAPAFIALALVVLFVSRGVDTRATTQSAAEAAAQAAAQERNLADATAAANRVGAAMLVDVRTCARPSVGVGVGPEGFAAGGVVTATVSCTRRVDDLASIAPGGSNTSVVTAFAVIDPFRAVDGVGSSGGAP